MTNSLKAPVVPRRFFSVDLNISLNLQKEPMRILTWITPF